MVLPIDAARERAGLSVPVLAAAIGINEPWCWDLLSHEDELTDTLSLRQVLRAASALGVLPLSLLSESVSPSTQHHSFAELAAQIVRFCGGRGITAEQFGELAGWEVQGFLSAPDTALDAWNLDCLRDVCATVGLSWPDFLPSPHPVA